MDLVSSKRQQVCFEYQAEICTPKVNSPGQFALLKKIYNNYALLVDAGITFNKSAFKHGFTEADIEWAFLHHLL